MKRYSLLLLCFLVFPLHAADRASVVFQAIDERLSYMEDVALFKAKKGVPVEDKERELKVLNSAKADAGNTGLDPVSVIDFFEAQIAAAKAIQYRHRADWLSDAEALEREPRDLTTEVRPALLSLGQKIIDSIKGKLEAEGGFSESDRASFMATVKTENLSERDKEVLFESLKAIKLK